MPPEKEFRSSDPVEVFAARPPKWRPPLHQSASLGWPDFLPDHAERLENVMSDTNIRKGISVTPTVPAESSSTHVDAIKTLSTDNAHKRLGDLMTDILARREAAIGGAGPSTFKPPTRVTMIDARRNAWFAELANSDIPLAQLSHRIPHGSKGAELFETLYTKKVPIDRAVWFVRSVGASETAAMRNRANYNPMFYSYETAKELISYYKKQLAEITLPSAIRLASGLKQTFKGVLLDLDTRIAWSSKFVYTIQLTREFYAESMIDHGTFLLWLAQQISASNLAQLGMFARVVDEYITELTSHRAFSKHLVDGSIMKLQEIETSPGQAHLQDLQTSLRKFVQVALIDVPDAFISPRNWPSNAEAVLDIVDAYVPINPNTSEEVARETAKKLRQTYEDVHKRNSALLFFAEPSEPTSRPAQAIAAIRNLNFISVATDLSTFCFFESDVVAFEEQLKVLLTWAVSKSQYGDHRHYAAATILRCWLDDSRISAIRKKARTSPQDTLQSLIFHWLHAYPIQSLQSDMSAISLFCGELIFRGVFSYPRYIQELVARGELDGSAGGPSHHLELIRRIPLISSTEALELLHRTSLYNRNIIETPEEQKIIRIQNELQTFLAESPDGEGIRGQMEGLPEFLSGTHYEQARVIHQWLLPKIVKGFIRANHVSPGVELFTVDTYAAVVQILTEAKLYAALLEFNVLCLNAQRLSNHDPPSGVELLISILDTFERYMLIWSGMCTTRMVVQALLVKAQEFRAQDVRFAPLLSLLQQPDLVYYLSSEENNKIQRDCNNLATDLNAYLPDFGPLPAQKTEIHLMITGQSDAAQLAITLSGRHTLTPEWPVVVWQDVIDALSDFSLQDRTHDDRVACVQHLTIFITKINERVIDGFDSHLRKWCEDASSPRSLEISASQWTLLVPLLINMCINNSATCSTVLEGFVYPVWRRFAPNAVSDDSTISLQMLVPCLLKTAILVLCLLLQNSVSQLDEMTLIGISLQQLQRLQTRRLSVYANGHFESLLESVCYLVALETNPSLPASVSTTLTRLKFSLLDDALFKQHVFRDPMVVKRIWASLSNVPRTSEMEERLEDTLTTLMNADEEPSPSATQTPASPSVWTSNVTELDVWRCQRNAVKVQISFRRLCRRSAGMEPDAPTFARNLEHDTQALFLRQWRSDELDFVAELLAGVDSKAVGELLTKAYQRIASALRDALPSLTEENARHFTQQADNTLSLMLRITSPLQIMEGARPTVPPKVLDEYMDAVCICWRKVLEAIGPFKTEEAFENKPFDKDVFRDVVTLCARILHFALGALDIWSPACKRLAEDAIAGCIQLANFYGTDGPLKDRIAFSLLLDTACYIIDELPQNPKIPNPNADIIRVIPGVYPTTLSPHMPEVCRHRIRKILQYVPKDYYVDGLLCVGKGTTSRVQSRPWEWPENLERLDKNLLKPPVEDFAVFPPPNKPVPNEGSVSLEMFRARGTRDRVGHATLMEDSSDDDDDNRRIVEERAAGDGLGGETSFARDWREGRVPIKGARLTGVSFDDSDEEEWPRLEQMRAQLSNLHISGSVAGPSSGLLDLPTASMDSPDHEGVSTEAALAPSRKRKPTEVIDLAGSDDGTEDVTMANAEPPARGRGKGGATTIARATRRARGGRRR